MTPLAPAPRPRNVGFILKSGHWFAAVHEVCFWHKADNVLPANDPKRT